MPAKFINISYPVPSNKNGHEFSSTDTLLSVLNSESSGLYLVGSQGMWHGGIHITDATVPWCALSGSTVAEQAYLAHRPPYKGEQFIRCMADGEIVAWRVCKDYDRSAIVWRGENIYISTSFVLVKHYIQPGKNASSGLTFHTLYMNMAPFVSYATERGAKDRKLTGDQRYYASAQDVLAPHPAGSLPKDTVVTLSNTIITRASDRRQFTQVTLRTDAKNAAGETLAAGTTLWAVSDQGAFKAAASAVPMPSWWAKCSPAYGAQADGAVPCTANTSLKYYLSSGDIPPGKNVGSLPAGFPLTYAPGNTAQQYLRPAKNEGDQARTFSLVTLRRDVGMLKTGDRVWVVSDHDNLTVAIPTSASAEPMFGSVITPPTPIAIKAGENIGHMGFYQLPENNGKLSRYQVHIECLSMDDRLPTFLTNPDQVGADAPAFLKYPKGALLYAKNAQGTMTATDRKTRAPGILTLSGVPFIEANGAATHYQIHPEGGWLTAADIKKLPQYTLGERGFVTLDQAPESLELIDGEKPPNNLVKGILEQLYKVAKDEPRIGSVMNQYNYKRLLDQINRNDENCYPEQEYLQ
ncbi:hypothetical protein SJI19_22280, partial [Acerihabitans sp. TG2]|nr:hypothetical protein [Acerihabitans sp. TG2]